MAAARGWPARRRLLCATCLAALLTGCAITREPSPTPPFKLPPMPHGMVSIPNAVPRFEPRSTHGNPSFYDVAGRRYYILDSAEGYDVTGVASWYGPTFDGLQTADGDRYNMYAMTAAHKTLPLPCYVRVTNLSNGRSIVVKVNDRGPFVANRLIDLSYVAAAKLDMLATGTALVEVQTITVASAPVLNRAAESPPPTLYVQVGAYSMRDNAERVVARLQTSGFPGAFVFGPPATRSRLYRVRIGPVSSVPEFDQLVARLATLGYPGARLVEP